MGRDVAAAVRGGGVTLVDVGGIGLWVRASGRGRGRREEKEDEKEDIRCKHIGSTLQDSICTALLCGEGCYVVTYCDGGGSGGGQ
ncbi:hypothetical protein E2C01_024067 [Portunus trituberculatus]|uniref:Uncharacterized protein n=1 Tax=Portunus trituberculatus TaxID=210409 RepID=A0A5B7EAY1_PORTR|nr:hypothetical protein [Portunus trituberculatus]